MESNLYTQDQIEFIRKKAALLPEPERRVIRAFFWEDCTDWQVGEELGISAYEAFGIKQKALESLKKIYDEEFDGDEMTDLNKLFLSLGGKL